MEVNVEGNFFFQAEDGIRDSPVTGVQTCALPISLGKENNSDFPSSGERKGKSLNFSHVKVRKRCD